MPRATAADLCGFPASTIPKPSSISSEPAIQRRATPAPARPGDNLFTCSLIAVNVDTGKMAWYFQTSVHDTHDWDSAQTPILIDATINGRQRKLVSTAARNGYFYTLDRVTGEHVVTIEVRFDRELGEGAASDRRGGSRSRRKRRFPALSFRPSKVE